MVADALDDGEGAGVAHREPLPGQAPEERPPRRRPIEHGVADDDVVLGHERRPLRRPHRQHPAGEPLPGVVVGLAPQREVDPLGQPGAEALAARTAERHGDRPLGQPDLAERRCHRRRQQPADGAVPVQHRERQRDRLPPLQRRRGGGDELVVEGAVEDGRRVLHLAAHHGGVGGRRLQHRREVDASRLPVVDGGVELQQVGPADEVVEAADPQPGHDLPGLVGHQEEVVHDVLGGALEAPSQLRVLRGDADRAGVEVADPHHDAAGGDQGGGGETHVLGAEQAGHDDVAARLHLAVDLDGDAGAQPVADQRLLRLGQAQLPGDAGRLDRAERRRPGAALVAGDDDMVGAGLGHPGGDGAHTDLGHELD